MEAKLNEVELNGIKYVRKDSIQEKTEIVNFTGEETVATRAIGKKVIVRSCNEGINAGIVVLADESGVELKNCRRLKYHAPKDKKLSWYEGIAQSGISSDSIVSGTTDKKIIIEKYSMTFLTDEAFKSIMELKPNEQS